MRCAKFGVSVFKISMLDWLGGQSVMGIYALFYIYRSAKFGVAVFKASMLHCQGVHLPYVYMHCSAMRCAKFGVSVFKISMLDWVGGQSVMGIYALFYIYRSAKFGVVVCKASMLDCKGG